MSRKDYFAAANMIHGKAESAKADNKHAKLAGIVEVMEGLAEVFKMTILGLITGDSIRLVASKGK